MIEIGRSVDGRPITAVERGTPGGTVVLVIGVIHGDEAAGVKIVEQLATAALPPGIDLWLIESMNPDGQAAGTRTNARLVDLNRNFPYAWAPLGEPGDSQYGGSGPASEPETQAIVDFITAIQPDIGIWYHQDLFRIAPGQSGRDADVRARYAELTGLPAPVDHRGHLHGRRRDVATHHDPRRGGVHRRARAEAQRRRRRRPRRRRPRGRHALRSGGRSDLVGDEAMVVDDLVDDEAQELLGERRVQAGLDGQGPEAGDLLASRTGSAGGIPASAL